MGEWDALLSKLKAVRLVIFSKSNFVNNGRMHQINFIGMRFVYQTAIIRFNKDENHHPYFHVPVPVLHGCNILRAVGQKTKKADE